LASITTSVIAQDGIIRAAFLRFPRWLLIHGGVAYHRDGPFIGGRSSSRAA
jgi:hypothetical protein